MTARDAIQNVFEHAEQQKDLAKSLIRAKMELELLVIDDKHVSLACVDHVVMKAKAEKASKVLLLYTKQFTTQCVAHNLTFYALPMLANAYIPLSMPK